MSSELPFFLVSRLGDECSGIVCSLHLRQLFNLEVVREQGDVTKEILQDGYEWQMHCFIEGGLPAEWDFP